MLRVLRNATGPLPGSMVNRKSHSLTDCITPNFPRNTLDVEVWLGHRASNCCEWPVRRPSGYCSTAVGPANVYCLTSDPCDVQVVAANDPLDVQVVKAAPPLDVQVVSAALPTVSQVATPAPLASPPKGTTVGASYLGFVLSSFLDTAKPPSPYVIMNDDNVSGPSIRLLLCSLWPSFHDRVPLIELIRPCFFTVGV